MRRIAVAVCSLMLAVLILLPKLHNAFAQLATSAWPMFHRTAVHTGQSTVSTSGNNGTLKWKFATGFSVESSPAIGADGTIYVGEGSPGGSSGSSNLYAVNPDGTQKWAFATGGDVFSSPAIAADETIYVGSYDDNLYAVNADGTQKWAFATRGPVISSPAIGADGTVYVASEDNNVYALTDGGQGTVIVKWAFPTGGQIFDGSPAIAADGTIYVGSQSVDNSGQLYAINPDGSQKWTFTPSFAGVSFAPAIGADGTIYVGSANGTLYAVNPDGSQKWAFPTGLQVFSSPAIGADGTIYVGSYDNLEDGGISGHLYALTDGGLNTVTLKWAFATGTVEYASPAIGADGTIYIASENSSLSKIYAVNPDGSQKWAVPTVGSESSPAIGADGTIYIGTDDSHLYALVGSPTTISVPASFAFGSSPVGDKVAKNLTVKNTGKTNPLFVERNLLWG